MELLHHDVDETGSLSLVSSKSEIKPTENLSYTVNLDGNARQLGRNIAAATTVKDLKEEKKEKKQHRPHHEIEFYPPRSVSYTHLTLPTNREV